MISNALDRNTFINVYRVCVYIYCIYHSSITSPRKKNQDPLHTSDGRMVVSEDWRVCCELILEGFWRMESPLTDTVAPFLITTV